MQAREEALLDMLQEANAKIIRLSQSTSATLAEPAAQAALNAVAPQPALAEVQLLADAAAEIEQLKLDLACAEAVREEDVQKVGAFWLEKLSKARAETAAAVAQTERLSELNAKLESEIFALEADYDALQDRVNVQQEMVTVNSFRLTDLQADI